MKKPLLQHIAEDHGLADSVYEMSVSDLLTFHEHEHDTIYDPHAPR